MLQVNYHWTQNSLKHFKSSIIITVDGWFHAAGWTYRILKKYDSTYDRVN